MSINTRTNARSGVYNPMSPMGRLPRRIYWPTIAALFVVPIAINFLLPTFGAAGFVFVWMQAATITKRLHDAGRSGWLNLIWIVASIAAVTLLFTTGSINALISDSNDSSQVTLALSLVLLSFLPQIGVAVWAGVLKPDPNDNRYGPAAQTAAATFD